MVGGGAERADAVVGGHGEGRLGAQHLVDEIGIDAARYALVRNSLETNLDIDIDVWTKATSDNPVFYVQYAATRAASRSGAPAARRARSPTPWP